MPRSLRVLSVGFLLVVARFLHAVPTALDAAFLALAFRGFFIGLEGR
jgi:hypothetical protein